MPARTLKSIARSALNSLGFVRAMRAYHRRACRILVYHRFPDEPSLLAAQCEHIRQLYHPVSMSQVAESLRAGSALPYGAITITVDDGFRDFLLNAQSVFSRYEIPVTVFVITDFLDGKAWPWFSQIHYMVARTKFGSVRLLNREFALSTDRVRATVKITEALKPLPNTERIAQVEVLRQRLEVDVPACPPSEYEPLTWGDLRELAAEKVQIGSHTRTHPVLSSISDSDELHREIAGSKQRLDDQLGIPTQHFCYPFGTRADFNNQVVAMVRSSGFATAVTAETGLNDAHADPFRLVRLGVEPSFPVLHFAELLAGVRRY